MYLNDNNYNDTNSTIIEKEDDLTGTIISLSICVFLYFYGVFYYFLCKKNIENGIHVIVIEYDNKKEFDNKIES